MVVVVVFVEDLRALATRQARHRGTEQVVTLACFGTRHDVQFSPVSVEHRYKVRR